MIDNFLITKLSVLRAKGMMTGKFWSLEQNKKGWVDKGKASVQMCRRANECVRAWARIAECVRV